MTQQRHNLIALGSAAVIAVYSAGFLRTRSAAEAMESQSAEMRPKLPPLVEHPVASHQDSAVDLPKPVAAEEKHQPRRERPHAKPAESTTVSVKQAPVVVEDSAPSLPTAPVAPPPAVAIVAADSVSVSKPDSARALKWKDGVFHGYGTSRHGDIEAEVEIKNGRITSAKISQCLTRYSCSWIDPLLPQVVERQTYNVDFISGATQSSDAFRYAVWEALSRAK
jgi:uncharacterized protein with FMN-binding domain